MIRVLVVDDLRLVYEGLKSIFVENTDIQIVGFAKNGKNAIAQIEKSDRRPDIVLIDVLMPVMDGIEAIKEISKLFPEVKVIVLSSFEDDSTILKAIAVGAKGYLLKSTMTQDLVSAILAVNQGAAHFAPGIIDSLAEKVRNNSSVDNARILPQEVCTVDAPLNKKQSKVTKTKQEKKTKKQKPKKQKPLFQYGDWLTVIISVIVLSQTDGMGHHLAHAGLFFLMLSLIARPMKALWNGPLKHRRAVGILAFAAAVAHAFYATFKVLDLNLAKMLALSSQSKWGIIIGILSLLAMTPAAITSFQFFQRKLGKKWRQIHLLTVPALALAILHTVLVGPHYMATSQPYLEVIDYLRIVAVTAGGAIVFLLRRKLFWSILKSNKAS